jgi:subtilisin family serine protease
MLVTKRKWLALFGILGWLISAAPANAVRPKLLKAKKNGVPNRYLVVLTNPEFIGYSASTNQQERAEMVDKIAKELARQYGGRLRFVWHRALNGFSIEMSDAAAERMATDGRIHAIDQDLYGTEASSECSPGSAPILLSAPVPGSPQTITCSGPGSSSCVDNWGLDRIDQRGVSRNGLFYFSGSGAGVNIYIVDTGINSGHDDFYPPGGGPSRVTAGFDVVGYMSNTYQDTFDCHGHGTHVAAIAAGRRFGVAKNATLHPVKIRSCDTQDYYTTERAVTAFDWLYGNAVKPAVVNLSWNFDGWDYSLDHSGLTFFGSALTTAVRNVVVGRGIPVVNSAGNSNTDAGNFYPTGTVPELVVVGASDTLDRRWGVATSPSFSCSECGSNYGGSVDLFAPGKGILSAYAHPYHVTSTPPGPGWNTRGACERTGTSMAAPLVTGVIAVYLQNHPNATVAEVTNALLSNATVGAMTGDLGSASPNRLLFSGFN